MKILPYNKFAVAGFGNQFDYTQFPYQDAGLGAGGKIKARLDWRYVFAFARLSYLVRTATRFDISLEPTAKSKSLDEYHNFGLSSGGLSLHRSVKTCAR
jgi:hypothetical protein